MVVHSLVDLLVQVGPEESVTAERVRRWGCTGHRARMMSKPAVRTATAVAMLAMASFAASAQDLTGTVETLGSKKSKLEACKSAQDMARLEIRTNGLAWKNIGKTIVRERVGSCDCEQEPDTMYDGEVLKKGKWSCLVEWSVEVEDWE